MYKKLYQLIVIIGIIFLFGTFVDSAYAKTFNLKLVTIESGDWGDPSIGIHLEYGNVIYKNKTIGNYRLIGSGVDIDNNGSIKSGNIYIEFYKSGYLFIEGMTSKKSRDRFKGIITGGTSKLKNATGDVSGKMKAYGLLLKLKTDKNIK
jgi:hypothetical protein